METTWTQTSSASKLLKFLKCDTLASCNWGIWLNLILITSNPSSSRTIVKSLIICIGRRVLVGVSHAIISTTVRCCKKYFENTSCLKSFFCNMPNPLFFFSACNSGLYSWDILKRYERDIQVGFNSLRRFFWWKLPDLVHVYLHHKKYKYRHHKFQLAFHV